MATSIHPSIPVLSPSFLYHPYIPSFQSKDFSFTCITTGRSLAVSDIDGMYYAMLECSNMHVRFFCAVSLNATLGDDSTLEPDQLASGFLPLSLFENFDQDKAICVCYPEDWQPVLY